MRKITPYLLCTLAGLLLLIAAACNLPGSLGGNTTNTPEALPPPSNTDGAETILIPGATFWMGSTDTDTLAAVDEMPFHRVTLDSFYLYTHEVTNKMYAACVDAGFCLPINVMESGPTTHYGNTAYDEYPVVGVDWNMARDYCAWANARLPTEAEWELAARGTESLLYPWGSEDPACDRVNMLGCAVPPDTVEVGSYLLGNSPFEVWDMSGNVWEWVHDWYAAGYYPLSPANDPLGPYAPTDWNNPLKVVRGGGLYSGPDQMRSADRAGVNPYRAYDDVGFRCVAAGEALPEGYIPPLNRHEMVPPDPLDGGGEHAEDPDETPPAFWLEEYYAISSCPDSEGNIHIAVGIEAAPGTEFVRLRANGAGLASLEFSCTYDEMLHVLNCEGPTPSDYNTADPFPSWVEVRNPGSDIWRTYLIWVEKPTDCDRMSPNPLHVSLSANCGSPDRELITVHILSDAPVNWGSIRSFGVFLPYWEVSDTEAYCNMPVDPDDPRTEYPLDLYGWSPVDGTGYTITEIVSIPADCPATPRGTNVEPFCFEGHPTVHVAFTPLGTVLESASSLGVPLSCIGMTPVDMYCGVLPGEAGMPSTVTTCFVGETCESWPINVPDCGGAPAHWYFDEVIPVCYEGLGPVAVIHYTPSDSPLVVANANGLDLTCYDSPEPGWYMCSGLPGAPGDPMTISFCLADGTCFSEPIIVSDCGTATWDADDWQLIAVGCHDETQLYFMIDTGLGWLIPGAEVTYSASDGETTYSCSVHATVPGRVYCAGTRPESPGDLQFCVQRAGDAAPTCTTFPEYDIWVNATPPCQTITVTPPPPQTLHCSDYTDAPTCNSHWADGCKWGTTTCTGP